MIKFYRGFKKSKNGSVVIAPFGRETRGKWIYGGHIRIYEKSFINVNYGRKKIKVIPYTVDQAVPEKTDVNGKNIFEGDIISAEFTRDKTNQTIIDYYIVEYDQDICTWLGIDVCTGEQIELRYLFEDKVVVVGNRYENNYSDFRHEEIDNDDEYYDHDAHSCSANADDYGICQVCGAIVHGTQADHDLHGYEYSDYDRDYYDSPDEDYYG